MKDVGTSLKEAGSVGEMSDDARFRLLVEAVTDYAIYMLDPTGIVVELEPRRRARSRATAADEIIGKHFSQFYTEPKTGARACRSRRSRPPRVKAGSKTKAGASARTARDSGRTSSSIRSVRPTAR